MIKAELDRQRHERNLKAFAKAFGDSSQQAVIRWGVQIAREFAVSTQPFGRGRKAKEKGRGAIYKDALKTIWTTTGRVPKNSENFLYSVDEINSWIDQHRNKNQVKELPKEQRKVTTVALFEKAIKQRAKKSGTAKQAWIDAGNELAAHQTGAERITISKRFLGWTVKSGMNGRAKVPSKSFIPSATITNMITYSGEILDDYDKRVNVRMGLKKTLKWYRKALAARERKANTK
jgi:hypothetical protein